MCGFLVLKLKENAIKQFLAIFLALAILFLRFIPLLVQNFNLIVVFSLNRITTSFVTDRLCLNIIYDATTGL